MTHLAQADEIVRQYWKDILLPDVSNSKELTGSFAYTGGKSSTLIDFDSIFVLL